MTTRQTPGARPDHRLLSLRLAVRAATVLAATAGVALPLGRLLTGVLLDAAPATHRSGPAALDAWVGSLAAAGALLTLGWWATSFTVAVVAQARSAITSGQRLAPPLPATPPTRSRVPSVTRRLAAAALGVALTAGPVTAHATVDRPAGDTPAPTVPTAWSVDRPGARSPVVVRPGDTLWSLAAARLGDGDRPDPRAVAAAWPRWWHANRAVVGPDPDLIRPGQVLHPPTVREEDR